MNKLATLLQKAPWLKEAGAITDLVDDALRETYFAIEGLQKEQAMAAFELVPRQMANVVATARQKRQMSSTYINKRVQYDPNSAGMSQYLGIDPEDPAQTVAFNPEGLRGYQDALRFLTSFHEDVQKLSQYMAADAWDAVGKIGASLQAAAKGFAQWLATAKFQ